MDEFFILSGTEITIVNLTEFSKQGWEIKCATNDKIILKREIQPEPTFMGKPISEVPLELLEERYAVMNGISY